jgi:Flp pilus assembly protein TadG
MKQATGRDDTGQAMVEFALIAPLLFIFLFGIVQFGVTFGGEVGLSSAAREVARYASTAPANQTNSTIQTQADLVLRRSIPAYNPSAATTTVSYCWYTNPTNPITFSQKVIISITYGHTLFVPLVGALVDRIDGASDNRFTTGVREEMRVEAPPLTTPPSGTACSTTSVGANP